MENTGESTTTTTAPATHDPAVKQAALDDVAKAVTEMQAGERLMGQRYAPLVKATMRAMDAGATRKEIAGKIKEGHDAIKLVGATVMPGGQMVPVERVHKGTGARYVALARIQRGEYIKGETPLEGTVKIGAHAFQTPMDALESGLVTFSAVYLAFTNAVRPKMTRLDKVAPDTETAGESLANLKVKVLVMDEMTGQYGIKRVKLGGDAGAFKGAMMGLVGLPLAEQMLGGSLVKKIKQVLAHDEAEKKAA